VQNAPNENYRSPKRFTNAASYGRELSHRTCFGQLTGKCLSYEQERSRSSENPSTNIKATKKVLLKAITKAKRHRLETVLKTILDEHGQLAVEWLTKELLVPQSAVSQPTEGNVTSGDSTMEGGNKRRKRNSDKLLLKGGSKPLLAASEISPLEQRLRPRYATCEHCYGEFDVTKNESDACSYHPKEMERDLEFFSDPDDMDSDYDREHNPGGYRYFCCDEMGDQVGCEPCPHKEE
jgi:hypothetical protein